MKVSVVLGIFMAVLVFISPFYSGIASAEPMNTGISTKQIDLNSSLNEQIEMLRQTAKEKNLHFNLNNSLAIAKISKINGILHSQREFKTIEESFPNATFSINIGYQFTTGVLDAYFQLLSSVNGTSSDYTWTYNLSSGQLSRPTFSSSHEEYHLPVHNNMVVRSVNATANASPEPVTYNSNPYWDGYEYYDSYVGAYNINPITASSANVNVASFSEPPSGQEVTSILYNGEYYPIYRVASVWVGLSASSGGGGGLIQTGYEFSDRTNSYTVWYEIYPSFASTNYNGLGSYPIHSGDILDESLQQSGGYWNFEVYDYNNGHAYLASVASTENAYFSQNIVEATTFDYSGVDITQQIPQINTAINFEGSTIYGAGPGGSYESIPMTSLYDNNWYNQYYLQQDSNYPNNLNHAYIMQTGTYYTSIYGYTQETWANSYYNLYGGQNSPPSGGGGGCVLNGTLVSISRTQSVPVQNLEVGEHILSYNTVTNKFVQDKVTSINVTNVSSIIDVNNGLLYVSGTHDQPIYVTLSNGSKQWIMVGYLNTSDLIFDPLNHSWIPVTSIQIDQGNFTVYDLTGSKILYQDGYLRNNYIANGILLDKKMP